MMFGIIFDQISNRAELKKTRFRMESIARINVENPQKAPKIHTKSHRKWDRKINEKTFQKASILPSF